MSWHRLVAWDRDGVAVEGAGAWPARCPRPGALDVIQDPVAPSKTPMRAPMKGARIETVAILPNNSPLRTHDDRLRCTLRESGGLQWQLWLLTPCLFGTVVGGVCR